MIHLRLRLCFIVYALSLDSSDLFIQPRAGKLTTLMKECIAQHPLGEKVFPLTTWTSQKRLSLVAPSALPGTAPEPLFDIACRGMYNVLLFA